jgi:hypothetical protein
MVATFNGWEDMPEGERESLDQWEREQEKHSSDAALATWPKVIYSAACPGAIVTQ